MAYSYSTYILISRASSPIPLSIYLNLIEACKGAKRLWGRFKGII